MIVGTNSLLNQFVPAFYIRNLVDGQILVFDSTKKAFINVDNTGGGDSGVTRLGQLLDVTSNVDNPLSVQNGQGLVYNSFTNLWENTFVDYTTLLNKPVIPTNGNFSFVGLSDTQKPALANGYVRWNSSGNQLIYSTTIPASSITGLATVATTGSYTDLINKPTIGSGSVTSVSVVSINGVSGSVANATTTPAIALALGAITPSSVAATGTVSGSNLSGTNTGDQTITLTGDITGTGIGTFATTLATVNTNTGTFGSATQVPVFVVNSKGLITSVTNISIGVGTVTSISGSGGATGLTLTGGPITTSGTLTLGGTLVVTHGGTGLSSLGTTKQIFRTNSAANGTEWANLIASDVSGLATVATTGSYTDLINKPTIPTQYTDALARASISLTPGQSGVTYNNTTGVLDTSSLIAPNIVAPAIVTVNFFADISSLTWDAVLKPRPNAIQTSGYSVVGKGAAIYYRLPNTGSGAYTSTLYRIKDANNFWWALSPNLPVSPEQVGAAGDAYLTGGTLNGAGIIGGTPAGTDDTVPFTAICTDGYFSSVKLSSACYIIGDVRVRSYMKIFADAGAGYTFNERGSDPVTSLPSPDLGIRPTVYVKIGAFTAFNVAGGLPGDPVLSDLVDVAYGRGIWMSGFQIDASDPTGTGARVCIPAGSTRLALDHMQLINGTYGVGGAVPSGSIYTHTLTTSQCVVATCWRGIANTVDSMFINTQIANCVNANLYTTNGSNACTWVGGRNEFCQSGNNILMNVSSKWSFDGALCDRAWKSGAALYGCVDISFGTGWIWNRCGASKNRNGNSTPGVNTGNGTVDNIIITSPAALSYAITMSSSSAFTCTATGFGTVAGTVGVLFTMTGISFTITSGNVGFISGDTFTVATSSVADDNANLFCQGCDGIADYGKHGAGASDFNGTLGTTPGNYSPEHAVTLNQINSRTQVRGSILGGYANVSPYTETGTALGGSTTTIILPVTSSGFSGFYNGRIISITGGTGAGQTGLVTGYRGTTKVATVSAWSSNISPDTSSVYSVALGAPTIGSSGSVLYNSARNVTQVPNSIIDALGAEPYDNSSLLQRADGRIFYSNPFTATLNAAGGSDTVSLTMVGPPSTFAIKPAKLQILARDTANPGSGSAYGEYNIWFREEAVSGYAIAQSLISEEINTAGSIGFGSGVFTTGTCQAGSAANTIVLASGASSTTDGFTGSTITLTGGTGSGQTNRCTGYNGSTKTMLLARTWTTIPDATTTYSISFGSLIQLATSSLNVVQNPTDQFTQIATFNLLVTNRHASDQYRVFVELRQ